jgi:HPt (histidine-containing phosphotransfer) domain-containing protein
MDSTRHSTAPKTVRAVPLDDDFDDLRSAFERRLHSDRIEFVTLSAALASSEEDAERIFGELVYRAHRLRGAAEIFEAADFARAANALEDAAIGARSAHASHADPAVWSALVDLVNLIGIKPKL